MNEIPYMLKFKYDIIFGQSYELVPMLATDTDIQSFFNPKNIGRYKSYAVEK